MTYIKKIKLKNFKKFNECEITFNQNKNILIGDNEAGKSSILNAIELVLSGSRSKVDSLGIETLLNTTAVSNFLSNPKNIKDLPTLYIEIYLNDTGNPDLNGKNNSDKIMSDGLKLICEPNDDLTREIGEVLNSTDNNFPFEFYIAKFTTFSGESYSSYSKFLKYLLIDNSQINNEYAHKQYIKAMYEANTDQNTRYFLRNEYRNHKNNFKENNLSKINLPINNCEFNIRSDSKFNLESDLTLMEDNIPIENKGKGKQCFIKTSFALNKNTEGEEIDILLLEEPENHLSHINMHKLIQQVEGIHENQMFITTHSNLITSRLDLRNCILINSSSNNPTSLNELDSDTSTFFIKAPNHKILEFILSKKVILVEGDAEYILMEELYKNITENTPADDNVYILSVGGLSFKRYLEISLLLNIKTAVIRDNDKNYEKNCIDNYTNFTSRSNNNIRIFSDKDNERYTFEVCIYSDNQNLCDSLFSKGRQILSVKEYMLSKKTNATLALLERSSDLISPNYIKEAIEWIRK